MFVVLWEVETDNTAGGHRDWGVYRGRGPLATEEALHAGEGDAALAGSADGLWWWSNVTVLENGPGHVPAVGARLVGRGRVRLNVMW